MNLVWVGCEAVNLDLVKRFRLLVPTEGGEREPRGAEPVLRIELVFTDGSTMAFEGADAGALRCYLRRNSSSLDLEGGPGEFAAADPEPDCADGPLAMHADGGKEGA
jgi:hypothetical protein